MSDAGQVSTGAAPMAGQAAGRRLGSASSARERIRRSKLISLRMTQEEYERLQKATADAGARCVSDYARKMLLEPAHPNVTELEQRVARLEAHLSLRQICDAHS
ncbi:MAG TPA: hypothetical protein VEQ63_06090 [Bryobacteraceae bacterium]|nr:hypothetical protein [Bryobacteraceae bacterium]